MKKPDPTQDEASEWVKAWFRGETCREIAERVGRPASLVNAKLHSRGAYKFQRRKTEPL